MERHVLSAALALALALALAAAGQPSEGPPEHIARPGSVIAHFDADHEIQRLQLVRRDGSLATLFKRSQAEGRHFRRDEPAEAKAESTERPAGPNATEPAAKQPADVSAGESIKVVDEKARLVSEIVGPGVAVKLAAADEEAGGKTRHEQQLEQQAKGEPAEWLAHHQQAGEDETLEVLATVAADAIHSGIQLGEHKLRKVSGLVASRLRAKVKQKLRELPGAIEAGLRDKSHALADEQRDEEAAFAQRHVGPPQQAEQPARQ